MEFVNFKIVWVVGIVDKNIFIWGDDMDEWVFIGMVYGFQGCVEIFDGMFLW